MSIQNNAADQYFAKAVSALDADAEGGFYYFGTEIAAVSVNQSCPIIWAPNLVVVHGNFDFFAAYAQSIDLQSLTTLNNYCYIDGVFTENPFPALTSAVDNGNFIVAGALTVTGINSLLSVFESIGLTSSNLNFAGGNAAPRGAGLVNYQSLLDDGNSVTTNAIEDIQISGAGSNDVNGNVPYAGVFSDNPLYASGNLYLQNNGDRWEIHDTGTGLLYYESSNNPDDPIDCDWVLVDGVAPAPTLTYVNP